jgi:hypothetical protein
MLELSVDEVATVDLSPQAFVALDADWCLLFNGSPYTVTEFSAGITAGPDGNLWFTEPGVNGIGRITLGPK